MTIDLADQSTECAQLRAQVEAGVMVTADQSRILATAHAALVVAETWLETAPRISKCNDDRALTMVKVAIAAIEGRNYSPTPGATVRCVRCRVVVPMAALANPSRCVDPVCPLKPQE